MTPATPALDVDHASRADGLERLPADYSKLREKPAPATPPVLGPPLPGDLGAAMLRAAHQLLDNPPVFADPLALRIIGTEAEGELRKFQDAPQTDRPRTGLRAFIAARSRFSEDTLAEAVAQGIRQYVLLGAGLRNAMIAVAITNIPHYARLTRAAVLNELTKDYVVASRVSGAGTLRLMFKTVLPNCLAPLIVQSTLGISSAVLDAAALGFLGLGAQPPTPEWGTMLADARQYIDSAYWVVTFPGLAILVTVLAFNLLGDGLRDALDPKLKR